jgi:NADH:ubiquinone oxidoreductase subunit 5 (subunit L)/multisubunit Na+/H+ antiporter MnhA subunit
MSNNMTEYYAWLIPLLPLIGALWIATGYLFASNRGESGERKTNFIAYICSGSSFALILWLDFTAIFTHVPGHIPITNWIKSGHYKIDISFLFDTLGLTMTTLVGFACLLTIRFSVNYLHREAGYQRFFIALLLFMSGMLFIVSAGNVALTFIGWELAGISSYILIAYSFKRPVATENATQAFITNRFGDAGFILAIFFVFYFVGDLSWVIISQHATTMSQLDIGLVAFAFLIPALAKSAQFPFCPWITRALEGPTPSSAIFYGSLMVHAGIFLIIRLQDVLLQSPSVLVVLIIFGVISMLYGFLSGLVQTDIKSALIFSSITQIGFMFVLCGAGLFDLAAAYLVAHSLWRLFQFLTAPDYLHKTQNPPRLPVNWLLRMPFIYNAAINRFWLDNIADWLITNPTKSLAKDSQVFDYHFVNRFIGLPGSTRTKTTLPYWERKQLGGNVKSTANEAGDVGRGSGALGSFMEWVASSCQWFEEHLILKGGNQGLLSLIHQIGKHLEKLETLLSKPRYLLLLIMATFAMII